MNKGLFYSLGVGACVLIIASLLYAATERKISEIRNDNELNKFLTENRLVLIQFYSPSCPVCIAFKKKRIFQDAANRLPDVHFAMVSSEEANPLHSKYNIANFPTFVYFIDSKPVKRTVGYVDNPTFTTNANKIFQASGK